MEIDFKVDFIKNLENYRLTEILSKLDDICIDYVISKLKIKEEIIPYLKKIGFEIENKNLIFRSGKNNIRKLHNLAVIAMKEEYKIKQMKSRKYIERLIASA